MVVVYLHKALCQILRIASQKNVIKNMNLQTNKKKDENEKCNDNNISIFQK